MSRTFRVASDLPPEVFAQRQRDLELRRFRDQAFRRRRVISRRTCGAQLRLDPLEQTRKPA